MSAPGEEMPRSSALANVVDEMPTPAASTAPSSQPT
jgi:hypothetical protein